MDCDRRLKSSVFWLTLGISLIGCNSFLISPVMSDIGASLNATPAQVARAISSYGGATALSSLLLSRWLPQFGLRRSIRFGCLMLLIGVLLSGLSVNWPMLVIAQGIAGLAAGVMLPAIYSMVAVISPQGRESEIFGKVITGWSVAMVAGVPVSSVIAAAFGWRFSYFLVVAIAAVACAGLSDLCEVKAVGPKPYMRAASAGNRYLTGMFVVCFLYMTAFYGIYSFLGVHVRKSFDASAGLAGLFVMAYGVGFGLASFCGKFIDRITPRLAIFYILLGISGVYLAMGYLEANRNWLIGLCIVWGFINHLGLNSIVVNISLAAPDRKTVNLGLFSTISYGGTLIAGLAFGHCYEARGFAYILYIACSICVVSAVAARVATTRAFLTTA
jgi:DHA1 family inner membrane transport protein